jgi:hypothetical protein
MTKPNPPWVAAGGGGRPQYLAGEIRLYSRFMPRNVGIHRQLPLSRARYGVGLARTLCPTSGLLEQHVSRASMAVTAILRAQ